MPYPKLNRHQVKMKPLAERKNKKQIERDHVAPDQPPPELPARAGKGIARVADRIRSARAQNKPVMVAFGAHTIKNGLAPVLIRLMENGWITHLATNGAGIIHDWEYAFQGASSEDVAAYVKDGQFGNWEETGFNLNLALNIGAWEGKGYGESIGAMIHQEGLNIPSLGELELQFRQVHEHPEQAAAAADLIGILRRFDLSRGRLQILHPFKRFSVQEAAFRFGIPFTAHPMIGHDILYNHPMNHGGLLGRAAVRDFLTFAEGVSRLDGGVYLSVGSAIMSPMIFEKSLSMAQNLALQSGRRIENHNLFVVDLAKTTWDWRRGEPPEESPDYYLRYNKTFSRMGGTLEYLTCDNRDFFLTLCHGLKD